MRTVNRNTGIKLRLVLGPEIAFGPGKAELLKGIQETGSISAAGRKQGMSYKRAWQLVDTMNRDFREPLVVASKGGQSGGGAALTPAGRKVLDCYLKMVVKTEQAIRTEWRQLQKAVTDISR